MKWSIARSVSCSKGMIAMACLLGLLPADAQRLSWQCYQPKLDALVVEGISGDATKLVGYIQNGCFFIDQCLNSPQAFYCGTFRQWDWGDTGCWNQPVAISANGEAILVQQSYPTYSLALYKDVVGEVVEICVSTCSGEAASISADGTVVLVDSYYEGIQRWTESSGLQPIGVSGGAKLSANGAVVLGSTSLDGQPYLFRWTETTGVELLQPLPGFPRIVAVSADGSIATLLIEQTVYRWSADAGLQNLNLSIQPLEDSVDMSLDGSTIYGTRRVGSTTRAFRWTESQGLQELFEGYTRGASADGSILVGVASSKRESYVWSETGGLLNLNHALCVQDTGSYLEALGVSHDGRYIIGRGSVTGWGRGIFRIDLASPPDRRGNPQGDVNFDGVVDDADLLTVLFHFGQQRRSEVLAERYSHRAGGGTASVSNLYVNWNAVLNTARRTLLVTTDSRYYYEEGGGGISTGERTRYLAVDTTAPQPLRARGTERERSCRDECWEYNVYRTLQAFTGYSFAVFHGDSDAVYAVTHTTTRPMAQCYTGESNNTICPYATAISENGAVVVGEWRDGGGNHVGAFRTTGLAAVETLPTLGANRTHPTTISADGAIIAGKSEVSEGVFRAFRYTVAGGIQDLGTLGGERSEATHISRDGARIFGKAETATGEMRLFHWNVQNGMQDMGIPAENTEILFLTDDGSVVVGRFQSGDLWRVFRWSAAAGMHILEVNGYSVEATDMTANGSIIVGRLDSAAGDSRAFRWMPSGEIEDLGSCVPETRVCISPDGLRMAWISPTQGLLYWWDGRTTSLSAQPTNPILASQIWGMAYDGSLIVTYPRNEYQTDGCGPHRENWHYQDMLLLFTPVLGDVDRSGTVDDADLLFVLFNFGADCR